MTEEDKILNQLQIDVAKVQQRLKFLEMAVYWFIGFLALNLIGSFLLWAASLKNNN